MSVSARPVVTYARKRKDEDAAWREIAPIPASNQDVQSSPPTAPKEQPKKQPPKPGQASILSFVGKSAPDPFEFAQSVKRKPAASASTQPAGKQLFLDFGQRNLASQACLECGLTYSAGVVRFYSIWSKCISRILGGGRGATCQVPPRARTCSCIPWLEKRKRRADIPSRRCSHRSRQCRAIAWYLQAKDVRATRLH